MGYNSPTDPKWGIFVGVITHPTDPNITFDLIPALGSKHPTWIHPRFWEQQGCGGDCCHQSCGYFGSSLGASWPFRSSDPGDAVVTWGWQRSSGSTSSEPKVTLGKSGYPKDWTGSVVCPLVMFRVFQPYFLGKFLRWWNGKPWHMLGENIATGSSRKVYTLPETNMLFGKLGYPEGNFYRTQPSIFQVRTVSFGEGICFPYKRPPENKTKPKRKRDCLILSPSIFQG